MYIFILYIYLNMYTYATYNPWKLRYPLKIDGWTMQFPFGIGSFSGDVLLFSWGVYFQGLGFLVFFLSRELNGMFFCFEKTDPCSASPLEAMEIPEVLAAQFELLAEARWNQLKLKQNLQMYQVRRQRLVESCYELIKVGTVPHVVKDRLFDHQHLE